LPHALAGSPYAVARALQQLAGEDECRELRPDELRYALGMIEPEQLLSDLPPAVGRIVWTLVTAKGRFSQCELADRADVSTRTIWNYRDRLQALDLIHVDESGYRLALSFQMATERHNPVVPTLLEEGQTLLEATDTLLRTILPTYRYGDPDDPLGGALFWSLNPSRALEHSTVSSWMQLVAALSATEFIEDNRAVQMGSSLKQQPLSQESYKF
jgi:hypothetical protein